MSTNSTPRRSFSLGSVFATPGALEAIARSGESPATFLGRHAQLDWGCISPSDTQLNNQAVESGARILSAYDTQAGVRLWVITDAADDAGDRSATTILLPQEY